VADTGKSTLQTILENIRDAGVSFGKRFTPPPANVLAEVRKLLAELGIDDPGGSVSSALESVAANWKSIADSLSAISLDFTDPAAVIAGIGKKSEDIKEAFEGILKAPETALSGLGASGAALRAVFPERLLHYIVYDFITKSHEKVGGVFLLLGVLRREVKSAAGNPALIDNAEIRVFDLPQLIHALTHPREAFLRVLKWGKDDFNARPLVDGMVLLLGTLRAAFPGISIGPDDDTFPLSEESPFVKRNLTAEGLKPSARHSISNVPSVAGGTTALSFVGLHKHGLGLQVPNPVNLTGKFGSLELPKLPPSELFAFTPGNIPETDPPSFKVLP
jgi:hypothetical protein